MSRAWSVQQVQPPGLKLSRRFNDPTGLAANQQIRLLLQPTLAVKIKELSINGHGIFLPNAQQLIVGKLRPLLCGHNLIELLMDLEAPHLDRFLSKRLVDISPECVVTIEID